MLRSGVSTPIAATSVEKRTLTSLRRKSKYKYNIWQSLPWTESRHCLLLVNWGAEPRHLLHNYVPTPSLLEWLFQPRLYTLQESWSYTWEFSGQLLVVTCHVHLTHPLAKHLYKLYAADASMLRKLREFWYCTWIFFQWQQGAAEILSPCSSIWRVSNNNSSWEESM